VDVSNYFSSIPMAPRPPEHPEPWTFNRGYCISQEDALNATKMMAAKGIKPEFECFQMSDMHYVRWLVNHGFVDPFGGRNWIQFVYTMGSNWNTPEFMSLLKQVCPRNSVLGIIATGPQQWPVLAQALIHGLHVRVGMEDNVYYAKGQKAESNAQLVEKICRIADDLGRRRATCEEARQILGLGAPRTWK